MQYINSTSLCEQHGRGTDSALREQDALSWTANNIQHPNNGGSYDQDDSNPTLKYVNSMDVVDPGLWTHQVCIIGLALMWLTGLGVIVYGSVVQSITDKSEDGYEPSIYHHKAPAPFLQLAISFVVTAFSDVAGLIHSTSLRFTLLASRRLAFNSNLRLFTSCKNSAIHWWPVNLLWGWSLISSYACGSMVLLETVYSFSNNNPDGTLGPSRYLDVLSGYSLIFLGFGLLGQASIASWALIVSKIPTWSTNPIHIATVCQIQGWLSRVPGRSMLSVHDAKNMRLYETPAVPKPRQGSLLTAHYRIRRALMMAWVVTLLAFAWFAACSLAFKLRGNTGVTWGSFSRSYGNDWSIIPNWVDTTAFLPIPTSLGHNKFSFGPWFVCKYLLTCAFTAGITLNLHIVELIVQASRDESLWRKAASSSGLAPESHSAIYTAISSWETIVLFVFKGLIQWMFGLAFGLQWEGIEIRIPQVLYMAILLLALAGLATCLALHRPKGPQPATFGHLPTLVNLIDVWPSRMPGAMDRYYVEGEMKTAAAADKVKLFWGDKGEHSGGIRHAGTAFTPLEPIVMAASYL